MITPSNARIEDRALGMICPYCGARRGRPCRTRTSGELAGTPHAERWIKAKQRLISEGVTR